MGLQEGSWVADPSKRDRKFYEQTGKDWVDWRCIFGQRSRRSRSCCGTRVAGVGEPAGNELPAKATWTTWSEGRSRGGGSKPGGVVHDAERLAAP